MSRQEDGATIKRQDRLLTSTGRLHGLAMDTDTAGEPGPRILRLDRPALDLFDEMRIESMRQARASRGLTAGWHGKSANRTLRLAVVYELLAWAADTGPEPNAVRADAMVRAGGYIDYLSAMLDRVTAGVAMLLAGHAR